MFSNAWIHQTAPVRPLTPPDGLGLKDLKDSKADRSNSSADLFYGLMDSRSESGI